MVIYLKHAQHGNKVAISEDEAKADEKNGWERYKLPALVKRESNPLEKLAVAPEKISNTLSLKKSAEAA